MQILTRRLLQHAQHRTELLEQGRIGQRTGPVHLGRQLEQGRQRTRRIEIIIHRRLEFDRLRMIPIEFDLGHL